MYVKSFDEFQVGDQAELQQVITAQDIDKFVALTGDDNPLHVDKAFAKKTPFKDVVAHGMLGASFVSTLVGKHIPGHGALWVSQQFDFLLPVRVGDKLNIRACVIEKHISQRILVLETIITNQHKQTVVKGIGKVKCLALEKEVEDQVTSHEPVILITGGSRGIGAATAITLGKKGYRVIVNYAKDKEGAEATVNEIISQNGKAIAYQADVTDNQAVERMMRHIHQHCGSLTGLVYCATSQYIANDFQALVWEDLQNHLNVQLRGAFYCVQHALKTFILNKQGAVVFLGSLAADALPAPKVTAYAAAKAALQSMSKSLALEYGPLGIRFNVVSPGMTETSLIADVPEKARLLTKMQIPLRRLAKPEDIAGAIEFLLSEKARHITGETLRIYGGQLMV